MDQSSNHGQDYKSYRERIENQFELSPSPYGLVKLEITLIEHKALQ